MKVLKYWLPTLLWAFLIFNMSGRSGIHTTDVYWQDFIFKKTAHFIEYFIFAILVYRSLRNTTSFSQKKILAFSFIITVVYAASDEFHQSFVPGREPRVRDVLIDSAGSLTGLVLRTKLGPNLAPHT